MAGSGYYQMASDQLERFRRAVDDERTGREVEALVRDLEKAGCTIGAIDELKTAPRGYPKDHPRIALLRRKGLIAHPVVADREVAAHEGRGDTGPRHVARRPARSNAWLDDHVGPSHPPATRLRSLRLACWSP